MAQKRINVRALPNGLLLVKNEPAKQSAEISVKVWEHTEEGIKVITANGYAEEIEKHFMESPGVLVYIQDPSNAKGEKAGYPIRCYKVVRADATGSVCWLRHSKTAADHFQDAKAGA